MEEGIAKRKSEKDSEAKLSKQSSQQLSLNEGELRSRLSQLETSYQRLEQLAKAWQNFGQYTAKVLKNEMDTYEVKVQLLQEQVEKLSKENKELREMCLYLDRSENVKEEVKFTPPESSALLLHTSVMSKLNKRGAILPTFSGVTSNTTLKDERKRPTKEAWSGKPTREALEEMKKRVERLETEKLELIKSLSAAHLLTATSIAGIHSHQNAQDLLTSHRHSPPLSSVGSLPQPPPEVEDILLLVSREGTASSSDGEPHRDDGVSTPDIAINAATLLDVCRRLDAAELSGHKDPIEEAEFETLRVLLNIAWQKIQEQQIRRTTNVVTTNKTQTQ